jgi:2,4'-dihydroxyacetophenone dioxygenase
MTTDSTGSGVRVEVARGIPPEMAVAAEPQDPRVWVPQAPTVWFRPLLFNTVTGQWCNLLRVTASGVVNRHRHPGADVFTKIERCRAHYEQVGLGADYGDQFIR